MIFIEDCHFSEVLDEEVNRICLCYDVQGNNQEIRLRQLFQLAFNCPCKLTDLAGAGNILEIITMNTVVENQDFNSDEDEHLVEKHGKNSIQQKSSLLIENDGSISYR
ncbi:unnamed protein product [Onchocerca flexuosa]|uniref:Uncharacterized protein n=1 Tax=Onchocerca flexuosa TaxID=387005 RepID=A0A3P7UTC7_9BILA|nr:unnamed protein product [Onchocerca flexuosa]